MQIRRIRRIMSAVLSSVMCLSMTSAVYASDSCSITVCEKDHDGNGISGSTVQATLIAEQETSGAYKFVNGYEKANVNLDSLSDPEKEKSTSLNLSRMNPVSSKPGMTDQNGSVKFSNLKRGLYLITESSKSGKAESFSAVEPYLISVPDSSGRTDITSYPKTEKKDVIDNNKDRKNNGKTHNETRDTQHVKTGDDAQFMRLILAIAASLMALMRLIIKKKKRE